MDDFLYQEHTCSECGKKFVIDSYTSYRYKISNNGIQYQCSYTCYDHALLRKDDPDDYYPSTRYAELVKRCETSMLGQGKKILCPIKL